MKGKTQKQNQILVKTKQCVQDVLMSWVDIVAVKSGDACVFWCQYSAGIQVTLNDFLMTCDRCYLSLGARSDNCKRHSFMLGL